MHKKKKKKKKKSSASKYALIIFSTTAFMNLFSPKLMAQDYTGEKSFKAFIGAVHKDPKRPDDQFHAMLSPNDNTRIQLIGRHYNTQKDSGLTVGEFEAVSIESISLYPFSSMQSRSPIKIGEKNYALLDKNLSAGNESYLLIGKEEAYAKLGQGGELSKGGDLKFVVSSADPQSETAVFDAYFRNSKLGSFSVEKKQPYHYTNNALGIDAYLYLYSVSQQAVAECSLLSEVHKISNNKPVSSDTTLVSYISKNQISILSPPNSIDDPSFAYRLAFIKRFEKPIILKKGQSFELPLKTGKLEYSGLDRQTYSKIDIETVFCKALPDRGGCSFGSYIYLHSSDTLFRINDTIPVNHLYYWFVLSYPDNILRNIVAFVAPGETENLYSYIYGSVQVSIIIGKKTIPLILNGDEKNGFVDLIEHSGRHAGTVDNTYIKMSIPYYADSVDWAMYDIHLKRRSDKYLGAHVVFVSNENEPKDMDLPYYNEAGSYISFVKDNHITYTVSHDVVKGTFALELNKDTSSVLGVEQEINAENKSLLIYPNPVSESLIIERQSLGEARLVISNSLGQAVYTDNLDASEKKLSIPFSHAPAGAYYVRIIYPNGSQEGQMFIKQ